MAANTRRTDQIVSNKVSLAEVSRVASFTRIWKYLKSLGPTTTQEDTRDQVSIQLQ
jgi:hypothetical protein